MKDKRRRLRAYLGTRYGQLVTALGTVPIPESMLATDLKMTPEQIFRSVKGGAGRAAYVIQCERYYHLDAETLARVLQDTFLGEQEGDV